jgi:hypothetical protein
VLLLKPAAKLVKINELCKTLGVIIEKIVSFFQKEVYFETVGQKTAGYVMYLAAFR